MQQRFYNFFLNKGAMESKIVRMALMNQRPAQHDHVEVECSNALIKIARLPPISATELTTAVMDLMRNIAIYRVLILNSNVKVMADAFLIHGNVMEILIVKMEAMKIQLCAVSRPRES